MKRDGFIATSLIYSFFLVFIAVITALLSNYIANKTILDRFNEEVESNLNSTSYSVTVYSKNSNIQGGITLTNIITNGNFTDGLNFWNASGSASYEKVLWLDNYALFKNNNGVRNSYVYQNINVLSNSTYYYSIEYSHNNPNIPLNTYVDNSSDGTIRMTNNDNKVWTRDSNIYESKNDMSTKFVLGDSGSFSYTGQSYFSNVMLINLTASYGSGYIPAKEWIDNNIDWFDGTISFIKEEDIESGTSVSIRFSPFTDYNNYTVSCVSEDNTPINNTSMIKETINDRDYYTFVINSIASNIKCNIDWRV